MRCSIYSHEPMLLVNLKKITYYGVGMRGNRSSDPSPICFIPSLVLDNAYFRSITNTSIIYFTTSVNIYNTVFTTINNSARLLLFKFTYLLGVKYRHNNHLKHTKQIVGMRGNRTSQEA